MLSDKVLLTYKRKRFSFQTDFTRDTKATNLSPNIQTGSSWISSPKSECDANDEKLNNHHSGNCQCSICNGTYGFTKSLQQDVPATKGTRQSQIPGQKDMGPMVLRSSRVLSNIKVENISRQVTSSTVCQSKSNVKGVIQMDGSGRKSGLDYMTCAEDSSTALLKVHDRMGNPINLNESLATDGGEYGSGCPEVGPKMSLNSNNGDNVLCNDGALKDHSSAQLITFSRRAKTKHDAVERMADRNLNIAEKPSFSAICSSHVVGAKFSCEGSSQKCFFEEQVNNTPILLENCVVPSSQIDVADEMANVKVDVTSDCTAEVCIGSKIKKRLEASSAFLMSPLSAVDTYEELSKEFLAAKPAYVVKDYICPLNSEPSNSSNNAFILSVEKSGSKLIPGTSNCEKRSITCLSEERGSPAGLELSGAPTSVCQMSLEANKQSPENHRNSQSSSTPSCSIVFTDEENDARSKEIEWLENLDNVLREKKKDRGACSLIVHDAINCREGFNSTTSNKSAEHSVNNQIGIDFVNHLTTLPEKHSLANLPDPSYEEQLKTKKSTSFTDFLGNYLPSNTDIPLDLNTAAASSGSHFRDNVYAHDWKAPYSSNGNTSLFKHKHVTENAITDMMLSGKQGSLSDKPKKYSSEWSEEELDFLWIGVRRHGVDNWNAILRDPKLQFAQSRFPEDLGVQWEQEQKKLFSGILFPPARLSKPNTFSTPLLDGHYTAKARAYVENPLFNETKLSLGDVYLQKENIAKSSQFGLTYPPISDSSCTGPLLGSFLSMSSYPGAPMRHKNSSGASRAMYQMDHGFHKQFRERSGHQQRPVSTDLPHWLKEACSSHPSPSDLPWPPFFTAGNATSMVNNDTGLCSPTSKHGEPFMTSKDLRGRGILKRKSMISAKNTGIIKIEEASASVEESGSIKLCATPIQIPACERPALGIGASHQKNITDLSHNIPVPIVPNDLVVLDSDASSEETISDDQNGRPQIK